MRARGWIPIAVALVLGLAAHGARAAARLEYRGAVLPARVVQSLAAPALRAPADSAALAAALGGVIGRLQNLGYLDARARAEWDSSGRATLSLQVAEGERLRVRSLALDTPGPVDSARFAGALGLAAGAWASPTAVREELERTLREVTDHGYPYATLGVSGWTVDSSGVALRLSGALGPQVTISRVRIVGLQVTRPSVAERSMGRLVGLPYDRAAAEAARDRLAQLGLFRSVAYDGLEGEGDWGRGHLVYRVEEPAYNRFEGVVGVQGAAGTVGLARLDLGNLLGTGRVLGLSWQSRGKGLADFGVNYLEPLVLGTPLGVEASLAQQVQDTLYVRTRWGAVLRYALSGQERIEGGFQQERVVQAQGEIEEAALQNTLFALERSTLEPPIGPRRGTRVRVSAAQIFKRERLRPAGARSARASAVETRGEWHLPLGLAAGLSLELLAAGRFSSQRLLPDFERYPLGGAATLRGYDEEAFRIDRYALTRLEWSRFLGARGQRGFVFWDHAAMATRRPTVDGGDRFDVLQRDGIGFGLRLEAAGGLVGVDYGLEPGRPPLEGKIHLRLVSTF
ncbi:MAG: hypothetical protein A2W00_00810 [Candidatus Eisenbacteria bacterium RBG_16_71_46]|nr:MAG: hypothetical protein A2W00_00810 [Candidatus Eisenbacteria bacterium RBG_16_71_46]